MPDITSTLFDELLFKGKNILVSAGPTVENIDPVRYISNRSSGKMGYAVAEAATKLGANVTLISGPTHLKSPLCVKRVDVKTAIDMYKTVMKEVSQCDIFISVAAVNDYRVQNIHTKKIKKTTETMELKLVRNPDILFEVTQLKNPPITVGFAAETDDIIAHARKKLKHKNLDIIAANEVGTEKGFAQDNNSLVVLTKDGEVINLEEKSKLMLSVDLLKIIYNYINRK